MDTIINQVVVPAGKYILGDPCYTVPDEMWGDLLESCNYFIGSPVGSVNGFEVLGFGTMYGDGTFEDESGNEFNVDAGLIGLVPWRLGGARWEEAERSKYGVHGMGIIVTFEKDVTCKGSESGVLSFGDHSIYTDPEMSGDYEWED